MIDCIVNILNKAGLHFCQYALTMLLQSGVVIAVLLVVDFFIRKRLRAIFRYGILMLVFVKLILPPTFYLPTGIGRWCGDYLSADSAVLKAASVLPAVGLGANEASGGLAVSSEPPQVGPLRSSAQTQGGSGDAAVSPNVTWPAVILLVWLVAVFVLLLLLIQRMLFVRGLIRQSEPATRRLIDSLNQCQFRIGIRKNIELMISHNVQSPAVCGLFRPKILLPASLPGGLSGQKLRAVLIDELAHI